MSDFDEARARRALSDAGLAYTMALNRASSVTNEVWLTDDFAIRVNRKPNQRLRREAYLGPRLPAGLMRSLHAMACPPDLPPIDAAPQLLCDQEYTATRPLLEAIDALLAMPSMDRQVTEGATEMVRATSAALDPFSTSHLVHGDITFENVLWNGTAISAMLDFEWARGGPRDLDLDLDLLLRFCAYPFLHVAADYEDQTLAADGIGEPAVAAPRRQPPGPHGARHQPPGPPGRRARPGAAVGLHVDGRGTPGPSLTSVPVPSVPSASSACASSPGGTQRCPSR